MTKPSSGARRGWVDPAMALGLAGVYLAVVIPQAARSYPSDDTPLLVPTLLAGLEGRSLWDAAAYLLAPDQPLMPRALWKLYVLGTLWLLGPSNSGLVHVGLALHAASSLLVLGLARRLGLPPGATWLAGILHLAAYPGSHAYLWPVGVQHVLTVLGILATVHSYLVTEQRRQAGRPWRVHHAATIALALASSLGRASSAIGPGAMLVHVLLAPGSAAERLARFDRWRPGILLSLLYPGALVAWGAEALPLGTASGAWLRQVSSQIGAAATWALALTLPLGLLEALRLVLGRAARRGVGLVPRKSARAALWTLGAILAAPWLFQAAVVAVWGVEAFFAPLGLALTGINTARWHVTSPSASVLSAGLAAVLVGVFVRETRRNPRLVLLLPLLVAPAVALHSVAVKPLRYWIYVTPALAIVLAASADTLLSRLERLLPRSAWPRAAAVALWAAVVLTNIAAVRVEMWRHTLADTYQVLDYIRAADLIRSDLDRSAAPGDALVCVNGLDPPPYAQAWRDTLGTPARFHDHAALAVLAQTLGRRDLSRLRLDCGAQAAEGARRYSVRGAEVTRDGRGIDPFERLDARVRALVAAGDHAAAAGLGASPGSDRPFGVRYLLGALPDPDMEWMTNGASLVAWLHEMAENYDHWFGQAEPKVQAIRRLLVEEVTAYVRFLFLVEYAQLRSALPLEGWAMPARRFAFGALRAEELDAILRSDAFLASRPEVGPLLDLVTAGAPYPGAPKILNAPRVLPSSNFLAFLWRLLASGFSSGAP